VNDGGVSRGCFQYEISREPALIKIVREWKSEGLNQVKVAIGPTRSAIAEQRIGRILEELDVGIKSVSLGSQSPRHFIDTLVRGRNFGVVILKLGGFFAGGWGARGAQPPVRAVPPGFG
jgi:hypothetical protein